jgi:hypothetical protein
LEGEGYTSKGKTSDLPGRRIHLNGEKNTPLESLRRLHKGEEYTLIPIVFVLIESISRITLLYRECPWRKRGRTIHL